MARCEQCGSSLLCATATCTHCGREAPPPQPPWARSASAAPTAGTPPSPWTASPAADPAAAPSTLRGVGPSAPPPPPVRPNARTAPAATGGRPPPDETIDLPAGLRPAWKTTFLGGGCLLFGLVFLVGLIAMAIAVASAPSPSPERATPEVAPPTATEIPLRIPEPTPPAAPPDPKAAEIAWTATASTGSGAGPLDADCTLTLAVTRFGTMPPRLRCGTTEWPLPKGPLRLHEWVDQIPTDDDANAPGDAGEDAGVVAPGDAPDAGDDAPDDAGGDAGETATSRLLYELEILAPGDDDSVLFATGRELTISLPDSTLTVHTPRFGERRDADPRRPLHGPPIYDATPVWRDLAVSTPAPWLGLRPGARCLLGARLTRFVDDGGFCVAELLCGGRALYGAPGSVARGADATDASWLSCVLDDSTGKPIFLRDDQVADTDGDPLLIGALDGDLFTYSQSNDLDRRKVELRVLNPGGTPATVPPRAPAAPQPRATTGANPATRRAPTAP